MQCPVRNPLLGPNERKTEDIFSNIFEYLFVRLKFGISMLRDMKENFGGMSANLLHQNEFSENNHNYRPRIELIMKKLQNTKFFMYDKIAWDPPLGEEKVAALEKQWGIRFPEDYRYFIVNVAASGNTPYYGLSDPQTVAKNLDKPFPLRLNEPIIVFNLDSDEYCSFWKEGGGCDQVCNGFLELCHEGCGMFCVLVVNSSYPEVYGTVWFKDFANDFGLAPLVNPKTKQYLHFLDWLEYYADHFKDDGDDSAFISFGEIAQGPDKSEINKES